jgi:hypothetical protein
MIVKNGGASSSNDFEMLTLRNITVVIYRCSRESRGNRNCCGEDPKRVLVEGVLSLTKF